MPVGSTSQCESIAVLNDQMAVHCLQITDSQLIQVKVIDA